MAAIPLPVAAQDSPPGNREIVVEGALEVDGTAVRRQAREITQRPSSSTEPLARWQVPVCAGVYGLSLDPALAVIRRIHENAEMAGLELDPDPECAANVWLIVVDDPADTLEQIIAEDNWMVRPLEQYERNRVREQTGPVRAWNLSSTRTPEGRTVPTGHQAVAMHIEELLRNEDRYPWTNVWNMSRLRTSIRRDIEGSFVLVERAALGNIDAFALADYASMRMFARTGEPEGDVAYGSILSLFESDAAPDRLTAFDRAYLRSINQGDAHRPSSNGLPSLEALMEEELLRDAGHLSEDEE